MSQKTTQTSGTNEHPFGPSRPIWRIWLVRVVVFSVTFSLLMSALTFVGTIVKKFFIVLYTN